MSPKQCTLKKVVRWQFVQTFFRQKSPNIIEKVNKDAPKDQNEWKRAQNILRRKGVNFLDKIAQTLLKKKTKMPQNEWYKSPKHFTLQRGSQAALWPKLSRTSMTLLKVKVSWSAAGFWTPGTGRRSGGGGCCPSEPSASVSG